MCCARLAGNAGPKKSPKSRHLRTIAQVCRAISLQLRHVSTIGKENLLNSNTSSACPHNMVNFGPLTAEISSGVWGAPANFNGLRVLAALLHGTLVVGVSQTVRRWTEGATYIWQGGHHVGHWPTFLVLTLSQMLSTLHAERFITFRVRRSRGEMYIGHGRLSVCVSVCPSPHSHTTIRTPM